MRKKFLSMVLFGLVTLGMTTTFQSCKNYDDDISKLNSDVESLLTRLENLDDDLNDKINDANNDISALSAKLGATQTDVANLQTKATELTNAVNTAQSTADAAQTAANNAQTAANNAQTTADNAGSLAQTAKNAADAAKAAADAAQNTANSATTLAQAAQAAAEAAQTTANSAVTAAARAQSTADGAVTAAGNAQTTADEAKAAAQTAQSAADAAMEVAKIAKANAATADEKAAAAQAYAEGVQANLTAFIALAAQTYAKQTDLDATNTALNLETLARAAGDEAQAKALKDSVANLKVQIAANKTAIEANATAISGLDTRVTALEKTVDLLWSAIVSLDVYANETMGLNSELHFYYVTEQDNQNWGNGFADETITTTAGKFVTNDDSLVIRVNPTIAKLDAYKDKLVLINSQGADLSDFLEITDVHQYNASLLVSKSATTYDNGLYVVRFHLKNDAKVADFVKAIKSEDNKVCFAIAAPAGSDDRYIVSDYNVTVTAEQDKDHVADFTVNKVKISDIHNRYNASEDGTSFTAWEQVWKDSSKPATKASDDNTKLGDDARQDKPIINVAADDDITIDFGEDMPIRGFYVTLDYKNAVEGDGSEIGAWVSHSYENVGVINKAGEVKTKAKMFINSNTGTIKVKKLAGAATEDVVGFRVFAINLDGTLVDPDGIAFYVGVGPKKSDEKTIEAGKIDVKNADAGQFATYKLSDEFKDIDFNQINLIDATGEEQSVLASGTSISAYAEKDASDTYCPVTLSFFSDEECTTNPVAPAEASYVKVAFTNAPGGYIDDATYTVKLYLKKYVSGAQTRDVRDITINVKKDLPTAHELEFLEGVTEDVYPYTATDGDNLVVYKEWDTGENAYELTDQTYYVDLQTLYNDKTTGAALPDYGTGAAPRWSTFTVNGVVYNFANKHDYKWNSSHSVTAVDGKTAYDVTTSYYYGKLSKTVADGADQKWVVSGTAPALKLHSWIEDLTVSAPTSNINVNWSTSDRNQTTDIYIKNFVATIKEGKPSPVANLSNMQDLAKYLMFDGVDVTVKDKDGKTSVLFKATITRSNRNGSYVTLTQISRVTAPDDGTVEYIVFTVKDCFGVEKEISVPFVINVN